MIVGMHDDATGFPNLALMKLSAAHKARGDEVEMFAADRSFDFVYSSKVFTFSPVDANLPEQTLRGGQGYGERGTLPESIEHAMPDYSLYGLDYSVGFLTRGCNRDCTWCGVPGREGPAHAHADVEEFAAHRDVVLLDNNVLQCDHGIAQLEKMAHLDMRVDFNQGLDARLIDDGIARRLAALKWLKPLRLACDHKGMMPSIQRAVTLLRWHNCTPRRYFVYCLIRDVDEAIERVKFLKGINVDPFAQPYIAPDGTPATLEQRRFARWVNMKAEYNSRTWEQYRDAR